ncbi:MmcQ/YjbR family DNA-binding protein [Saccharopolyspora sp. NPDC047091]|uniref:MmcQ/YjbR family DNA-binding protein n=1 Tax=Saccharopolyspora sp. NPDC047091 TaxID=3155924 RepID=UPI0033FECF2C
MTPHELKSACLAMPGAREEFPFDESNSVFKVAGKLFAISRLDADPLRVSLKCEPDLAVYLRTSHPDAVLPGYHLNKRHWNTVVVNATVPDHHVRDMIEDSYDLVVAGLPKREQQELDWLKLRQG